MANEANQRPRRSGKKVAPGPRIGFQRSRANRARFISGSDGELDRLQALRALGFFPRPKICVFRQPTFLTCSRARCVSRFLFAQHANHHGRSEFADGISVCR